MCSSDLPRFSSTRGFFSFAAPASPLRSGFFGCETEETFNISGAVCRKLAVCPRVCPSGYVPPFVLLAAAVGPRIRYCRGVMSTAQRARLNEIVSVDPELMHGAPCFRGTRVPVRLLLDDLKSGSTIDEFLAGCPTVSREFVEGYLELAQDLVTECVAS